MIDAPPETPSLDQQAQEILRNSLDQSQQLLDEGRYRQAVQELLWLLETISTAFQGVETDNGAVGGKYFNKIVDDLRHRRHGTALDRALDWIVRLHGYLSSPTGGGIRHGGDLAGGATTNAHEARLFCNLIRSYVYFLIAEHEQLTGARRVLD